MKNLFEQASSHWVKYSEYTIKDGYVTPAPTAKPDVYDPLKDAKTLVVDALNVGGQGRCQACLAGFRA
jgi:hypothetical protein